ncbi:pyridoxamine 5'-phosphate oxidase family protein [Halospeciosus flavus]|nr:pyridoxamine 5'-phosphate oxidase family protein [Halospeciosus flavus]
MLSMKRDEIGAFLKRHETGILSTCSEGEAYGIPESFGYRNGRLYLQLAMPSDSRKREFLAETETVSFTICEATSSKDFASVIIQGTVHQLPHDGKAADLALAENDQFPSSEVFPMTEEESIEAYELKAEKITGRKGPNFEIGTATAEIPVVANDEEANSE